MLKTNHFYRAEIITLNYNIDFIFSNNVYKLLKDLKYIVNNNYVISFVIMENRTNSFLFDSDKSNDIKRLTEEVDVQEKVVQIKTQQIKNGRKWEQIGEQEVSILTEKQYDLTVNQEALKFFRRMGGTEKVSKNYTRKGYNVVNLVSTSPDKQKRTVYKFDYSLEKMEQEVEKFVFQIVENLKEA